MTDGLAVFAGKLSAGAIRAAGAGLGSNLPGRIALAISPAVLSHLAGQAKRGIIAVSGTNGKSTTAGFISAILKRSNFKIAHNRQGANLVPGVTASLIEAASWTGKMQVDFCLFEIDEAALPLVAKQVKIEKLVVTNLFRDQLDRFGELDTTASLIEQGIKVNSSQAVLNADDPNVAKLAPECPQLYYGIASMVESCHSSSDLQELSYCSKCGNEYTYSQLFYGQLGHYFCRSCDNKRPEPAVRAEDVVVSATGSTYNLCFDGKKLKIDVQLPGLFNVYNSLAAAALAISLGLDATAIQGGLSEYSTLFGRSERVRFADKQAVIQLIKNPAGASQAVQAAVNDPKARFLIAINDNYADGRDVSWLWDADFELLAGHGSPIHVSGVRGNDMAVRLKYAGVAADRIKFVPELEQALVRALDDLAPGEILWILPTYTCLLDLQKIARGMGTSLAGT